MKKINSFEKFLIRWSSILERILLLNSKFSSISYKTEITYIYIVIQVHCSCNNSCYYASIIYIQFRYYSNTICIVFVDANYS